MSPSASATARSLNPVIDIFASLVRFYTKILLKVATERNQIAEKLVVGSGGIQDVYSKEAQIVPFLEINKGINPSLP